MDASWYGIGSQIILFGIMEYIETPVFSNLDDKVNKYVLFGDNEYLGMPVFSNLDDFSETLQKILTPCNTCMIA